MKIIDLSQTMYSDMPVFPGTEKPVFLQPYTVEKNGFAETKLSMFSHTGTHIDAPSHMLEAANSLNKLCIKHFAGKAIIMDCTKLDGLEIAKESLLEYEDKLKEVDYVILKTNWSKYWGSGRYFERFPYLSVEAAKWLISFELKGIGIDAISIDDMQTKTFSIHHILFEKNMIVIENLTNLDEVKEEIFMFYCLPLKYENADGSPVRAIAIECML